MKAIICTQYGTPDVLQIKEVDRPMPKNNEIGIRIFSTAVNSGDIRLRAANPWVIRLFLGLRKPKKKILGSVLSGRIEAVGHNVSKYKVGDEVFGTTGTGLGSYAEYICLPEDAVLAIKPDNINHQEASTIPFGATTALYFLRKAGIKSGQKVLIYGASGAVGTAAVQLASYFGAEVTGVCSSSNFELIKSIGANKVIDYTKTDFNKIGKKYDVIFVTVDKLSFSESIQSLTKGGTLILGSASPLQMLQGLWTTMTSSQKVISGVIKQKVDDMVLLKELIEKRKLTPVVDKIYLFEQIAEAHRYTENGHKRGNVSLSVVNER